MAAHQAYGRKLRRSKEPLDECEREERKSWLKSQHLENQDPLEKEMATRSSILDWKIPWTEEPGGLVMVLRRVRHNRVTEHAH